MGGRGESRNAPYSRKSLGRLVGAFKIVSTMRFNGMSGKSSERLWQRDFCDRVIRDDRELDLFREYVGGNPAKWALDEVDPNSARPTRFATDHVVGAFRETPLRDVHDDDHH